MTNHQQETRCVLEIPSLDVSRGYTAVYYIPMITYQILLLPQYPSPKSLMICYYTNRWLTLERLPSSLPPHKLQVFCDTNAAIAPQGNQKKPIPSITVSKKTWCENMLNKFTQPQTQHITCSTKLLRERKRELTNGKSRGERRVSFSCSGAIRTTWRRIRRPWLWKTVGVRRRVT